MKKRLLSLFLLLTLLLSLVGCGTDPVDSAAGNAATSTTVTAASAVGEDTTTTAADAPTSTTVTASTASGATDGTTTAEKPTTTAATKAPTVTKAPTTTTTARPTTATTASAAEKQLVDRAFQLAQGAKMENVTLTGIVTSSQGYSEGYNNATFDLQVEGTSGTKTIYCYRVNPADSARTAVAVGDRLSLTGTIQNYKGTIEFYPAEYTHLSGGGVVVTTTTRPTDSGYAAIDEDGIYDSKEDVALYIHTYGKLPKNYVTKSNYNKNDRYQCVGGDRFYNKEGRLPSGETYYECDIDTYGITSRGAKRLVWTKSGIVYYTGDHYETFTQLYGER